MKFTQILATAVAFAAASYASCDAGSKAERDALVAELAERGLRLPDASSGSVKVTRYGLPSCGGQLEGHDYVHAGTVCNMNLSDEKAQGLYLQDDVTHCSSVRLAFHKANDCSGNADKVVYKDPTACAANPNGKSGCVRITCAVPADPARS